MIDRLINLHIYIDTDTETDTDTDTDTDIDIDIDIDIVGRASHFTLKQLEMPLPHSYTEHPSSPQRY